VSALVDFNLSDGDGLPSKIVAQCHVVFSRRVSSDYCKIGLHYVDIENNIHEQLVRFIEENAGS